MNQKGPIQFLKHHSPFPVHEAQQSDGITGQEIIPGNRSAVFPVLEQPRDLLWSQTGAECDLKQKVLYFSVPILSPLLDQLWVLHFKFEDFFSLNI